MKKLLISILVLSVFEGMARGLTADAQERIWYPPNNDAAPDSVLLTASAVAVIEIQDETSSTYIVYLETAAQTSHKMTDKTTSAAIADSLPEPTTIAMLGLCGFTLGRRKMTSR